MKKPYFLATWFGLALCTPFFATDFSDKDLFDKVGSPFCIRLSDKEQLAIQTRGYTDLNNGAILVDPHTIQDTGGDLKKTISQCGSALIIFTETRNSKYLDIIAEDIIAEYDRTFFAVLTPESWKEYANQKFLIIENHYIFLTAQEYATPLKQSKELSVSGTTAESDL